MWSVEAKTNQRSISYNQKGESEASKSILSKQLPWTFLVTHFNFRRFIISLHLLMDECLALRTEEVRTMVYIFERLIELQSPDWLSCNFYGGWRGMSWNSHHHTCLCHQGCARRLPLSIVSHHLKHFFLAMTLLDRRWDPDKDWSLTLLEFIPLLKERPAWKVENLQCVVGLSIHLYDCINQKCQWEWHPIF